MGWTDQVQAFAAVGSLIATIFGFGFVVHQIRLVRRSALATANAALSEQSLTILDFIAQNPALYPYLYKNKDLSAGDPNEVMVLCLCEMVANYCDMTVAMLPDLDAKVAERWRRFIVDTIACSPALRTHFQEHRLWYSDELLDLL